jgi:hypothetical protein
MAKKAFVYDGTNWIDIAQSTADLSTYQKSNRTGLQLVVPTGATNGTVSANGAVTIGSAVTSVTVNGAFSSTYDNYKIILTGGVASGVTDILMSLGGITTGYNSRLLYGSFVNTSNNVANSQNGTAWIWVGGGNTANLSLNMELQNPFLSKPKWATNTFIKFDNGDVGSTISFNNSTASATSFSIAPGSGTLTGGTIRIYGYNNGL